MQGAFRAIESALNINGEQAHEHELSWREARQTAAEWLTASGFQKKREVKGLVIGPFNRGSATDRPLIL